MHSEAVVSRPAANANIISICDFGSRAKRGQKPRRLEKLDQKFRGLSHHQQADIMESIMRYCEGSRSLIMYGHGKMDREITNLFEAIEEKINIYGMED